MKIEMLQEIPPRAIDPNEVITGLEKLFCGFAGDKVSFRTNLDPQLGRIKADPKTLEWLLVSLAVNALRAMQVRNMVIATSNIELDPGVAREMNVSPGSYIQVELDVTGGGVDAEPAIQNFAQQAHGAISVRDAGTGGIMVTMLLPRTTVEELPDRRPPGTVG